MPRHQTLSLLTHAKNVLLVAPHKWSIDTAVGVLALQKVLTDAGKKVTAIAPDPLHKIISFLPEIGTVQKGLEGGSDFIISLSTEKAKFGSIKYALRGNTVDIIVSPEAGTFAPEDITFRKNTGAFDVIVTLGVKSLEDCGQIFEENTQLFAEKPIINISASAANDYFGRVNLVDPASSSICEILFHMIQENETFKKSMTPELATVLLTGILAETDSFLSSHTTAKSLETASELQKIGAAQSDIIEHLFKQKSFEEVKVLGRILANLEFDQTHRMAWSDLSKSDFELVEADPEDVDHWMDQLIRHTNGADFVTLFVEYPDKTLINIRTGIPNLDFTELQKSISLTSELTPLGINFEAPKKSIPEVFSDFLRKLADWQETRLSLTPGTEIKKTEFQPAAPEEKKPEPKSKAEVIPSAPMTIPFEIRERK